MSLQDMRGQGPPGDIGTFQSPASIIVYQHVFSGTTYIVAARQGDTGWVLVSHGTVYSTVMNAVIATLPVTGGDIYVKKLAATVTASIVDGGRNDVSLTFERGTVLTVAALLDVPVIVINGCHGWRIRDLEIDGNAANQNVPNGTKPCGIEFTGCTDCAIENCYIHNVRMFGVWIIGASNFCGVRGSFITLCGWNCIALGASNSTYLFAENNECSHSSDVGISIKGSHCNVNDNFVHDMNGTTGSVNSQWGIGSEVGDYNTITDNEIVNAKKGVYLVDGCDYNIVTDNKIFDWDPAAQYLPAIHVYSDHNIISGNILKTSRTKGDGISLNGANYNSVTDNKITAGSTSSTAIMIDVDSNSNFVDDNTLDFATTGISINNVNCDLNFVGHNDLRGCTTKIQDSGTGTVFPTMRAAFVKELGTATWIVAAGSAMGIDIDAADEGAVVKIKLPLDLQQVVRIRVFGIAQVAEADGMQLLIAAGAGIDNETWNAEAIAVASKTSSTLNFANLDVIQWVFTSADDSDIGDLSAGDFLQWCCYYAAASGANCATDLLLAGEGLEIQYV